MVSRIAAPLAILQGVGVLVSAALQAHGGAACYVVRSVVAVCAGLVPDVLDLYPEVTVVASKVALAYLKGLTHRPFTERAVKGGDKARFHGFACTSIFMSGLNYCSGQPLLQN